MTLSKVWHARLSTASWLIFGVMLIMTLIWFLLQTSDAAPRAVEQTTRIALLSPPPPVSHNTVPSHTVRPVLNTSSSKPPANPKSTAAVKPASLNADKNLAMELAATTEPFSFLPDHADTIAAGNGNKSNGLTIGGGGRGSCGNLMTRSYLGLINSQVIQAFRDSRKTGNRDFQILARLWFDASGNVRQSELIDSTGDTALDAAITRQLGEVSLGQGIPSLYAAGTNSCQRAVDRLICPKWRPTGSSGKTRTKCRACLEAPLISLNTQ